MNSCVYYFHTQFAIGGSLFRAKAAPIVLGVPGSFTRACSPTAKAPPPPPPPCLSNLITAGVILFFLVNPVATALDPCRVNPDLTMRRLPPARFGSTGRKTMGDVKAYTAVAVFLASPPPPPPFFLYKKARLQRACSEVFKHTRGYIRVFSVNQTHVSSVGGYSSSSATAAATTTHSGIRLSLKCLYFFLGGV